MSAEDIDTSMKLGYNFPMGPLQLADFHGPRRFRRYADPLRQLPGWKIPAMHAAEKKSQAGHLGQKTGRGFFVYPPRAD